MIERIRDVLAPRRVASRDAGYRRALRWAALPVTDRRWAAPLSAVALGFGLFAGVAIGPSAAGTLATAPFQVIEVASVGNGDEGGEEEAEAFLEEPVVSSEPGGFGEAPETSSFAPIAPVEEATFEPEKEEPSDKGPEPEKEGNPTQPEKQELVGTVVHVNPAAGSYTVAETGGVMSAVHAGKPPAAGTEIEVPIRALANGTLAEAGTRHRTGVATDAELAGIVSFVNADPLAPSYAISNRGTSLLIHVQPDPSGALPPLPALGAYGTVTAAIEAGVLWQRQLGAGGTPFTHVELEGIVAAVEAETARLLLSADDIRESGRDVPLVIPVHIDTSKLVPGDSVLASADIGADGSLTLTGLAGDERLKGAEDAKAIQGDLVPEPEKGEG